MGKGDRWDEFFGYDFLLSGCTKWELDSTNFESGDGSGSREEKWLNR